MLSLVDLSIHRESRSCGEHWKGRDWSMFQDCLRKLAQLGQLPALHKLPLPAQPHLYCRQIKCLFRMTYGPPGSPPTRISLLRFHFIPLYNVGNCFLWSYNISLSTALLRWLWFVLGFRFGGLRDGAFNVTPL